MSRVWAVDSYKSLGLLQDQITFSDSFGDDVQVDVGAVNAVDVVVVAAPELELGDESGSENGSESASVLQIGSLLSLEWTRMRMKVWTVAPIKLV